jgi:hypothetical protein
MRQLTSLETTRQDYVDRTILQMIQNINPTLSKIEWDIEMIGEVRDVVEDWIVRKLKLCNMNQFYPYVEEHNGN